MLVFANKHVMSKGNGKGNGEVITYRNPLFDVQPQPHPHRPTPIGQPQAHEPYRFTMEPRPPKQPSPYRIGRGTGKTPGPRTKSVRETHNPHRCKYSETDLHMLSGAGTYGCVFLDEAKTVATKLFDLNEVHLVQNAVTMLRSVKDVNSHVVVPTCVDVVDKAPHIAAAINRAGVYKWARHGQVGICKLPAASPLLSYTGFSSLPDMARGMLNAVEGLNKMQAHGLVHGDIKVDNLLVHASTIKIGDVDGVFRHTELLNREVNVQATAGEYFVAPPEFIPSWLYRRWRQVVQPASIPTDPGFHAQLIKTIRNRLRSLGLEHVVANNDLLNSAFFPHPSGKGSASSYEYNDHCIGIWDKHELRHQLWEKFDMYGIGVALLEMVVKMGSRDASAVQQYFRLIHKMVYWDPQKRCNFAVATSELQEIIRRTQMPQGMEQRPAPPSARGWVEGLQQSQQGSGHPTTPPTMDSYT